MFRINVKFLTHVKYYHFFVIFYHPTKNSKSRLVYNAQFVYNIKWL